MPSWASEEPDLLPCEDFYMRAFWALSTERQIGMAIGPIPESKITERAVRAGLDFDTMELFVGVIRALDDAYLQWALDEQSKARERAKK